MIQKFRPMKKKEIFCMDLSLGFRPNSFDNGTWGCQKILGVPFLVFYCSGSQPVVRVPLVVREQPVGGTQKPYF